MDANVTKIDDYLAHLDGKAAAVALGIAHPLLTPDSVCEGNA